MAYRFIFCAFLLFYVSKQNVSAQTIRGYVLDGNTQEALIGVNIYLPVSSRGTQSDIDGFFQIEKGMDTLLSISYLAYESMTISLTDIQSDSLLSVYLFESSIALQEAVVQGKLKINPPINVMELSAKQLRLQPSFGGEADIIQAFYSMPGVKKAGDANGGMLVRGGSSDQNRVVLDGVPIYQTGHIISFYSPFQSELVGSAKLYKGMIPASLGGRLSSALAIQSVPSTDSLQVELGMSLLLGKAYIQTPIIQGKWTMQLAARRSLPDLLWPIAGEEFPAKFYDGRMIHSFEISDKDHLKLSFYQSHDQLLANGKTISKFKETEKALVPEMQLLSKTTERNMALSYTHDGPWRIEALLYGSNLSTLNAMTWTGNGLEIQSGIKDLGFKTGINTNWKAHKVYAGMGFVLHHFSAMGLKSEGNISGLLPNKKAEKLSSGEGELFAGDTWQLSPRWSIESGMRLAIWTNSSQARLLFEPKMAINYHPRMNWTIQVAGQRNTQSLQKLSSSSISLPTDMWYPVNFDQASPSAWQGDLSLSWTPKNWSFGVSAYYKKLDGLNEFKEGAMPFLAERLADEVVTGMGQAYGADFLVGYHNKGFSAQVAYSLSWSTRQFDALNGGKSYYDRFDRRQDLSLQLLGQLEGNWSYSMAFYVATGARYTPRLAQYVMPGLGEASPVFLPVYGERNSRKLSTSHRLDLAINYEIKTAKASWQFQAGAYNVYNQLQSFRIENVERNGKLILREVGLFGMMPSLGVSVKF